MDLALPSENMHNQEHETFLPQEENGIEEITPIDYQLMHYGNPVFDFLYLMYCSTDRKFRKDNLINLKELYYETLRTFLKYFQLDVNVVYPREDYDRVFDEKLDFGLMIAIYLLPFLLSSGKQVPDAMQKEVHLSLNNTFKDHIQEVIEEFVEYGLI
ncbi:unnamed protein product [Arctia plantaginis]|uniref:Uncharacterized protein n=1 Tax=Arctia plantaginis TaxID=874455 RepID=A0A8S0YPX1_ARCPL|nr:unnamed protein product [Arctia plantaginis]